jgi:hypothetical protein
MRIIFFFTLVLFCFASVFSAGCLSHDNSETLNTSPNSTIQSINVNPITPGNIITPSVPSTYIISTNTTGSDPFIGFWWTLKGGRVSHIVYPNGNITSVFGDFGGITLYGNWTKTGENTYFVQLVDPQIYTSNATAVYYPETDTIIDTYSQTTLRRITD